MLVELIAEEVPYLLNVQWEKYHTYQEFKGRGTMLVDRTKERYHA